MGVQLGVEHSVKAGQFGVAFGRLGLQHVAEFDGAAPCAGQGFQIGRPAKGRLELVGAGFDGGRRVGGGGLSAGRCLLYTSDAADE